MTSPFVILEHQTKNGSHWDLMLEQDETLRTWRIEIPQKRKLLEITPAQKIQDHPLRFLHYQGPVQNNTAKVTRVDSGAYNIIEQSPDCILFTADGHILNGKFRLIGQSQTSWTLNPLCEDREDPARCEP